MPDTDVPNQAVKCPACGNADLDQLSVTRTRTLLFHLNRYPDSDDSPDMIWLDEDRCCDGDESEPVVLCHGCGHKASLDAFGIEEWEMA